VRLLLCCLLLGVGCSTQRERAAPSLGVAPLVPTHFLDEWFAVGGGRCRLTAAEPALTEPAKTVAGQVAEDLHVVDASFACEDAEGATVSVHRLPAQLSYVDEARGVHAPSTRTKLGLRQRDHVLFEVPAGQDGLLRARTYDARTGEPTGARERRAARLVVAQAVPGSRAEAPASRAEQPGTLTAIAPWPRLHDHALDSFLDRLAHTLATEAPFETLSDSPEGHAAVARATELYQRALTKLAPRLLAVRAIESREGQPRLTLRLEAGSTSAPVVSFEFELVVHAGEPTIVRLLDLAATQNDLECALDLRDVRARGERALSEQHTSTFCNALGVALPGSCSSADQTLLRDALRIGTRCGRDGELGLDVHEPAPAASDFEVRLRRGRGQGVLDSAPRYTVTLMRSGLVRFDGQHWVSARGAHEGRTSQALLSALSGLVLRLGWFDRPPHDVARCPNDERGDSISVRAAGRERSVRDREGCRGSFSAEELALLRRVIERIGAVNVWTTPALSPLERDAEIWVVAAE
jgi:hypothetical protein